MNPFPKIGVSILLSMSVAFGAVFGLSGCGGGGGGPLYVAGGISKGGPDAPSAAPNDITAGLVVASSSNILSDILSDANVTVNGVSATFVLLLYTILSTPPAVDAGETVTLAVSRGSSTVTASQAMPEKPVITGPASGNHTAANPIAVNWTGAVTDPEQIEVFVDGTYTFSGNDYDVTLPGNAISHTIPGGTLKIMAGIPIEVRFVEIVTTFSGGAVSGSTIEVEHESYVTINGT